MKSSVVVACAAMVAAVVLMAGQASSREEAATKAEPAPPSPEQLEEMMKKWMESMTPGEQHKALEPFVGKFDITTKMWMEGPGSKPTVARGSVEAKWILGKRYVQSHVSTAMIFPGADGKLQKVPYEGISTMGYDKVRNLYVGTWLDSMSTQIITFKGSADPKGKVFRMYGEMDESMLNVFGRYVKYVTRIVDENTHVFEIYDLHAGDDYKVMEITYNRKK